MAPILKRSELPQDAIRELRRCGQGNALFDRELIAYKRLFEEDETMDETYKILLVSLLSHANRNVEREADKDKILNEKRVLRKRVSSAVIEISSDSEQEEAEAPKSRDVGESSRVAITDSEVEYRRQVLEVMSKPYDMTDYTTLDNKLDDGLYAKLFPELGKELDKCRHNQRKRLALMRGFDFWIRDVAREGAFQPWRDEACLAVEPALLVTSPPPSSSSSRPARSAKAKQRTRQRA